MENSVTVNRGWRACCRISASVARAASLGLVKKYCWLRSSTAFTGFTGKGAHAAAKCLPHHRSTHHTWQLVLSEHDMVAQQDLRSGVMASELYSSSVLPVAFLHGFDDRNVIEHRELAEICNLHA